MNQIRSPSATAPGGLQWAPTPVCGSRGPLGRALLLLWNPGGVVETSEQLTSHNPGVPCGGCREANGLATKLVGPVQNENAGPLFTKKEKSTVKGT